MNNLKKYSIFLATFTVIVLAGMVIVGTNKAEAAGTPVIITKAPSSVDFTSATMNAMLSSTGADSVTLRGFLWGTDTNYGSIVTETGSFGVGPFSANLANLKCDTVYHYRPFAFNPYGKDYGFDYTIVTKTPKGNEKKLCR